MPPRRTEASAVHPEAFTALAVVLRSVLAGASSQLAHVVAYRILARLRLALADRLQRKALGRVQRCSSGEMKKLLHDDVEQLEESLAYGVPDLAAAAAVPLTTTALLMAVDWRLGLAALAALVLLLAVSGTGMVLANKNNAALAAPTSVLNTAVLTYLQGIKVIRGYLRQDSGYDQARTAVIEGAEIDERNLRSPGRWLVGAALYASGSALATILLAFPLQSLVLHQPVRQLTTLAGYRRNQEPIARKIGEVRDVPVLTEPEHPADPADAELHFENVRFTHTGAESDLVLDGVDFSCVPGTITALVGASGSGKTTLANLAARLWDGDSDAVRIGGGADLRSLGSDRVMGLVTTVHQDVYLFDGTVRFNVTLGRPEATGEEVWAALSAAQCDDVVRALPGGLDTTWPTAAPNSPAEGVNGLPSQGRCPKGSPVLIPDEAAAAVEPQTEPRIQEALARPVTGRTAIAIAHRLETVREVDRIVMLAGGTVEAAGTHEELLTTSPTYRALVEAHSS